MDNEPTLNTGQNTTDGNTELITEIPKSAQDQLELARQERKAFLAQQAARAADIARKIEATRPKRDALNDTN